MRRRYNPYTCIEAVRRSRSEVWLLVLVTVALGLLLGLLTDGLTGLLRTVLPAPTRRAVMALAGLLALLLTLAVAWLFHGRAESQRARIDLWLPYHFPSPRKATIAQGGAYQPPRHARRAFTCRYRPNSTALETFLVSSQYLGARRPLCLSRSRRIAKSVARRLDLAIQPEQGSFDPHFLRRYATFFQQYGKRIHTRVMRPRLEHRLSYRQCFEVQARLLAQVVEGKKETYIPFLTA